MNKPKVVFSIRLKLVSATFLIGLFVLTAGLSVRARQAEKRFGKNFIERAHLITWAFTNNLTSRGFQSTQEIQNLTKIIMAEPEVEYVAFFDAKKKIMAAAGNFKTDGKMPVSDNSRRILSDPSNNLYNVCRPIHDEYNEKIIGYIAAGFPTESLHNDVAENRRDIAFTWSLALIIVIASSYLILGRIISPLEHIKNAMMSVGTGDFGKIVPVRSSDEIGIIAGEYNSMVLKLGETYHNLSEVNKKLAEISERKSEFLSTVAHDLRTPLTLIGGFAETLSNKNLSLNDAQKEKYLGLITGETQKMSKFISDYLDVTKIEEGMSLPVTGPVKTEDIARAVSGTFDFESAKVIFAVNIDPKAKEITADPEMLGRALQNIVGNALKYAPANSGITLEISRGSKETIFAVSDTGSGIPDEMKEKIFKKFFRAPNDKSQKQKGSGLGLAIARSIVKLHGGDIRVEDNLPHGCRFIFTIPDVA